MVSRNLIVGLDPGGRNAFGWCVSEDTESLPLSVGNCGVANHCQGAVDAILGHAQVADRIAGVGIDSPLFWTPDGDRSVDKLLRQEIGRRGGPAGIIMSVNSLQGACLVQGVLAGQLIRRRFSDTRITESHPKALLWLLGLARVGIRANEVLSSALSKFVVFSSSTISEHERDAALGAVTAWAMLHAHRGWRNIAKDETNAIHPWDAPVSYWMPL
jgi:hypothetical protein